MSGPKVMTASEIRMMEEERERLRIELAKREERMRLVQARFRKADILKRQIDLASQLQAALAPVLEEPGAADLSARLLALERANREAIEAWAPIEQSDDNDVIRLHVDGLDQAIEEAERCIGALRQPIEAIRAAYTDRMMEYVRLHRRASAPGTGETIAPPADISREMLEGESRRLLELVRALRPRVEEAGMDPEALAGIGKQIDDSLSDQGRERWMIFEELHRIDVFHLRPLQAALEQREAENDALECELSEALARYHSLCSAYQVEPRSFPFRRESLDEIRCACGDLMERFSQAVDCGAIMERVRATLSELGYRYVGEKEEERRVYRQVYRIHDDTILHVVFDSTGRVTMEVAIEDDRDRLPYAREISAIVDAQSAFCRSFDRIVDSLDEHGLSMQKELLCPCGAEYAQIINTSGFARGESREAFDYSIYADRKRKYSEG